MKKEKEKKNKFKFKIGDKVKLIKGLSSLPWYTSESFYITGYALGRNTGSIASYEVSITFKDNDKFILEDYLKLVPVDLLENFYDEEAEV